MILLRRLRPKLRPIFVFGSNLGGQHGAGAALHAWKFEGAVTGVYEGLEGSSYAIPTKTYRMEPLPLYTIDMYVQRFIRFAQKNTRRYEFNVTAIGCGLAGNRPSQIAPMFRGAPPNVNLPEEFKQWL